MIQILKQLLLHVLFYSFDCQRVCVFPKERNNKYVRLCSSPVCNIEWQNGEEVEVVKKERRERKRGFREHKVNGERRRWHMEEERGACVCSCGDNGSHKMFPRWTDIKLPSPCLSITLSALHLFSFSSFSFFHFVSTLPSNKVLHCFALSLFYVGGRLNHCSAVSLDYQTTAL